MFTNIYKQQKQAELVIRSPNSLEGLSGGHIVRGQKLAGNIHSPERKDLTLSRNCGHKQYRENIIYIHICKYTEITYMYIYLS